MITKGSANFCLRMLLFNWQQITNYRLRMCSKSWGTLCHQFTNRPLNHSVKSQSNSGKFYKQTCKREFKLRSKVNTLLRLNIGTSRNSRNWNYRKFRNLWSQICTLYFGIFNWPTYLCQNSTIKMKLNAWPMNLQLWNRKTPKIKKSTIDSSNCPKWCKMNWINRLSKKTWP